MGLAQRQQVTVTTDSGGDSTDYSQYFTGEIISVIYDKTDFANGVDFNITIEDTSEAVWVENNVDASETIAPQQPTHDSAGAASLYAGAGEPVEKGIVVADSRIKIVIASGGDTKTGAFTFIVK